MDENCMCEPSSDDAAMRLAREWLGPPDGSVWYRRDVERLAGRLRSLLAERDRYKASWLRDAGFRGEASEPDLEYLRHAFVSCREQHDGSDCPNCVACGMTIDKHAPPLEEREPSATPDHPFVNSTADPKQCLRWDCNAPESAHAPASAPAQQDRLGEIAVALTVDDCAHDTERPKANCTACIRAELERVVRESADECWADSRVGVLRHWGLRP